MEIEEDSESRVSCSDTILEFNIHKENDLREEDMRESSLFCVLRICKKEQAFRIYIQRKIACTTSKLYLCGYNCKAN
jgi:hypothetical protein